MLTYQNNSKEEKHSDPQNLNFYLAKNNFNMLDFEVIKKKNLESNFGNIELAIIGSSHYFKLSNYFIEIMTCSQEEFDHKQLFVSEKGNNNFTRSLNFESFSYKFSVKTNFFADTKIFKGFENSLLEKKDTLVHQFYKNSDITALQFLNLKKSFSFKSWHTYPQHNKIIYSETELLRL